MYTLELTIGTLALNPPVFDVGLVSLHDTTGFVVRNWDKHRPELRHATQSTDTERGAATQVVASGEGETGHSVQARPRRVGCRGEVGSAGG